MNHIRIDFIITRHVLEKIIQEFLILSHSNHRRDPGRGRIHLFLLFLIAAEQLHKIPGQLFVTGPCIHSDQRRFDFTHVSASRPGRHLNAVPLKVGIFLDTPGIRLIDLVFRIQERAESHPSLVKIPRCDGISVIQFAQLLIEQNCLPNPQTSQIARFAVF